MGDKKTLVIGLGNPILRDDSVGLRVAQLLRDHVEVMQDVEIAEDYWGGLRLMERLIGYDRAVIIDAILTGADPGTLHVLSPEDIPTQRSASIHDVNLPTALSFGRQAGAHLPDLQNIALIAIEAADVNTFGETLSPEVEAALPQAVDAVLSILKREEE
jgi:hydrogenase maturation protease